MKIDKEKFNKLKQLDRIEYRQKLEEINLKCGKINLPGFINHSVYILGFILLLAISSYSINKEMFVSFLNIILPLSKLLLIVGFIIFIMDILGFFVKHKKINELNEEYFLVEVKK